MGNTMMMMMSNAAVLHDLTHIYPTSAGSITEERAAASAVGGSWLVLAAYPSAADAAHQALLLAGLACPPDRLLPVNPTATAAAARPLPLISALHQVSCRSILTVSQTQCNSATTTSAAEALTHPCSQAW
jgi:hypothetical protein